VRTTISSVDHFPEAEKENKKGKKYMRREFWAILCRVTALDNKPLNFCTRREKDAEIFQNAVFGDAIIMINESPVEIDEFGFIWNWTAESVMKPTNITEF